MPGERDERPEQRRRRRPVTREDERGGDVPQRPIVGAGLNVRQLRIGLGPDEETVSRRRGTIQQIVEIPLEANQKTLARLQRVKQAFPVAGRNGQRRVEGTKIARLLDAAHDRLERIEVGPIGVVEELGQHDAEREPARFPQQIERLVCVGGALPARHQPIGQRQDAGGRG